MPSSKQYKGQPEELIITMQPDIIIVGSDWKEKSTIKTYYGGELIFFDRMEDYSTTKTISRIKKCRII